MLCNLIQYLRELLSSKMEMSTSSRSGYIAWCSKHAVAALGNSSFNAIFIDSVLLERRTLPRTVISDEPSALHEPHDHCSCAAIALKFSFYSFFVLQVPKASHQKYACVVQDCALAVRALQIDGGFRSHPSSDSATWGHGNFVYRTISAPQNIRSSFSAAGGGRMCRGQQGRSVSCQKGAAEPGPHTAVILSPLGSSDPEILWSSFPTQLPHFVFYVGHVFSQS